MQQNPIFFLRGARAATAFSTSAAAFSTACGVGADDLDVSGVPVLVSAFSNVRGVGADDSGVPVLVSAFSTARGARALMSAFLTAGRVGADDSGPAVPVSAFSTVRGVGADDFKNTKYPIMTTTQTNAWKDGFRERSELPILESPVHGAH